MTPARRRPKIGLTIGRMPATVAGAPGVVDGCHEDYTDAVINGGGLPVLLPRVPGTYPEALLDGLDGLVLTGGDDIDPAGYGQQPAPELELTDPQRDRNELGLLRVALARQLPLLAICRGCQLLNVALGGTLVQHLPRVTSTDHSFADRRSEIIHNVSVVEDSLLYEVTGHQLLAVNSLHHQAIAHLAPGLQVVATAEDGTIEGVEPLASPQDLPATGGRPKVLAVQWHPESITHVPGALELFQWLVEASLEGAGAADAVGPTSATA